MRTKSRFKFIRTRGLASIGFAILALTACRADDVIASKPQATTVSKEDLPCAQVPSACRSGFLKSLYSMPSDVLYERPFGNVVLHVPVGFVSEIDLIGDPR